VYGNTWKQQVHELAISSTCKNITALKSVLSLTTNTTHILIRALIHNRLDYCNALFAGFSASAVAVCSESGCLSCTWAAQLCLSYCIAQISTASVIQTILAHVQVLARTSVGIPHHALYTDFRCLESVSAPLGWWQPAGGTKNTNVYVRSSTVLYIWSNSLEHFVIGATSSVQFTWQFQAFTENIPA